MVAAPLGSVVEGETATAGVYDIAAMDPDLLRMLQDLGIDQKTVAA